MQYNPAPAADAATSPAMSRMRTGTSRLRVSVHWLRQHFLSMIAAPVALIFGVSSTVYYWRTARFVVSTDDAYVQADSTIVASRVSGYVSAVLIQDDQPVKTGQILARIDDRDLRAALDQTRADVQASQAEVGTLQAQLAEQSTLIAKTRERCRRLP
jgi:membrane fusion protein (multidrug efflux system)